MDIMQYTENLTDICGVAHLMEDKERLIETYGDDICKYPYAIVVGHLMDHDIIESIPLSYNDDKIAQDYLDEYFNSHQRAAKIADKIADFIKKQGFDAIVLDVSGDSDEVNLKMPFSNKASANIAHIGWLGKNNLMITKEFGPRLTWVTILTNADLKDYIKDEQDSLCGDCKLCVNACPGNAICDDQDPRKSYDPVACGEYLKQRRDDGHPVACGMCLYICPYGNEKTAKLRSNAEN
ncbi:MAG: hypothetical protein SOZ23_01230 [Methanosphaera sp.]|uniref:hypothetical protein n=1 Tax=Methanosphaera sp. TaxID=2666342 RepID=UPI0025F5ADE3|nr:hypothetical protein [Methanosphaera sp.]MCI5866495.1 hypothetical protein [Methanosphaera sp.]MDY3955399.1 hypothetical protein [Methanosphaera sp.]